MIEADESDRSLLNYTPEIAVLTNADLDHHSTYSSRLDLEATFAQFTAGRAPPWCGTDPSCWRSRRAPMR